MKLSPAIIELLGKQCGREIATPADCSVLALDIETKIGEHVGINTIKRLLGFINDEREPPNCKMHTKYIVLFKT